MTALSRRGLLLAGCGLLVGCSSDSSGTPTPSPIGPSGPASGTPTDSGKPTASGTPTASASKSPTASGSPSSSPSSGLPSVPVWRPSSNDVQPAAKAAAVAAVLARLRTPGSAVEIVDAQYGGILSSSASVLVVCRRWTTDSSGRIQAGGSTVDVRLVRSGGRWRVTAQHPSQPGPAATKLSPLARQVLSSDRIILPPASAADVRSARVNDSVLRALLTVSRDYTFGVSVIRSGHPLNVFGTNRRSDHPQGRAFDAWQINGRAVIDPATPRLLVTGFMETCAAAGSYNVGGPYQLSGTARYFSDATHKDHVHAGFTT